MRCSVSEKRLDPNVQTPAEALITKITNQGENSEGVTTSTEEGYPPPRWSARTHQRDIRESVEKKSRRVGGGGR